MHTVGAVPSSAGLSLVCTPVDAIWVLPALTSVYLVQLAMHSIREMCAVDDCSHAYHHFVSFFEDFSALDASIDVDSLGDAEIEGTYSEVPCNHVH